MPITEDEEYRTSNDPFPRAKLALELNASDTDAGSLQRR
jgi:hypothetical protein